MGMRCPTWLLAAAMIAGCGSQASPPTTAARQPARGRPYRLYTHCGIEWARINGTFWRAAHPLSDGSGNPPAGWGNPDQEGRLVFVGPATATFHSSAGSVTFRRTPRTRPPFVCS